VTFDRLELSIGHGPLNSIKGDVSALEREIDELVDALDGLTPEETKDVEGAIR